MLKTILFPIDDQLSAGKALSHVVEIADKFKAKVVILHAYDLPAEVSNISDSYGKTYEFMGDVENNLLTHGKYILVEIENKLKNAGISVESSLMKGSAGPAIIDSVRKENADLIIMSSRGASAIERFLIGSVSDYVIHHTKCPVLLIH